MNKTITLIVGLIALANLIYSFFGNSDHSTFFGFEINIWVYRLIWGFLTVIILSGYFKQKKTSK